MRTMRSTCSTPFSDRALNICTKLNNNVPFVWCGYRLWALVRANRSLALALRMGFWNGIRNVLCVRMVCVETAEGICMHCAWMWASARACANVYAATAKCKRRADRSSTRIFRIRARWRNCRNQGAVGGDGFVHLHGRWRYCRLLPFDFLFALYMPISDCARTYLQLH